MKICIYGAASSTIDKKYIDAVESLGEKMAMRGHELIFGAGDNGMMGAAARGVKKAGGTVIGISPNFFNVDGVLFPDCDEMYRPDTMRERKMMLDEMSDAFIITPGGIGTLDEFFEIFTLKQLSRHKKAIVIYNIVGFYDGLISFLNQLIEKNFLRAESMNLVKVMDDPDEILYYIETFVPLDFKIDEVRNIEE
ncbi:MAG: TIGR00730 family Rossman fold protein [Lachnospiraceae bacterium]|nr:TIGR00730 family Rossman fold protein [Lachnospiraceae bacterium]